MKIDSSSSGAFDKTRPFKKNPADAEVVHVEQDEVLDQSLSVGQEITDQHGDKYKIDAKLGEGGMGSVYKATQERTELERAIKVMRPDVLRGLTGKPLEDQLNRFQREIRVLSKLKNPFILPALDVIKFKVGDQDVIGFVTELVEGEDLEDKIKKNEGRLNPSYVAEVAGQIAGALIALKEAGIVHRDIKPANIFLQKMPSGRPLVRLGDFGIAKFEQLKGTEEEQKINNITDSFVPDRADLTSVGSFIGSPKSTAPEVIAGEHATPQSDLYSLGTVLYEMVCGERVFEGLGVKELFQAHLFEDPKTFAEQKLENVPVWLEQTIMKLLSKNPKKRGSAAELFAALKEGVKKDFPELLNEVPFMYNFGEIADQNALAELEKQVEPPNRDLLEMDVKPLVEKVRGAVDANQRDVDANQTRKFPNVRQKDPDLDQVA